MRWHGSIVTCSLPNVAALCVLVYVSSGQQSWQPNTLKLYEPELGTEIKLNKRYSIPS